MSNKLFLFFCLILVTQSLKAKQIFFEEVPGVKLAFSAEQEDLRLKQELSPLRWTLLILIRVYQKLISPYYGDVCNFIPSCSHFGFQAIQKYGIFQGILMTADRLQRCHLWAFGEYPVDEKNGKLIDPVENHCWWFPDEKD